MRLTIVLKAELNNERVPMPTSMIMIMIITGLNDDDDDDDNYRTYKCVSTCRPIPSMSALPALRPATPGVLYIRLSMLGAIMMIVMARMILMATRRMMVARIMTKKNVEKTWLSHLEPGKAAISDKVFTSRTKKAFFAAAR